MRGFTLKYHFRYRPRICALLENDGVTADLKIFLRWTRGERQLADGHSNPLD